MHYYAVQGKLVCTPSFIVARRGLMREMGKDYPVVEQLSPNKVAKFKPKFKRK